jgi:ribosomal-protein-alanine N-acetyltransferase
MTISIDVARKEDVAAISEIERAAFSDPWSGRSFRDALEHPSVYFGCARSDAGEVLGYVVAWFVADEGEIANLAVAPAGWGSGIGRALLDAALAEAKQRRIESVYLEVRDSNVRARRLYQSRGFEEVGRRAKYYRRPVEDAIVLRRTLT